MSCGRLTSFKYLTQLIFSATAQNHTQQNATIRKRQKPARKAKPSDSNNNTSNSTAARTAKLNLVEKDTKILSSSNDATTSDNETSSSEPETSIPFDPAPPKQVSIDELLGSATIQTSKPTMLDDELATLKLVEKNPAGLNKNGKISPLANGALNLFISVISETGYKEVKRRNSKTTPE